METMTTAAKLLLLLSLVSYGQSESECQLKENAEEMLSVDYKKGPVSIDMGATIYVDKIEVKLKDNSKYVDLFKDKYMCPAGNMRITITYRRLTDSNWKVMDKANNRRISLRTKDPFVIPNIDPCDTYEVNVTISSELVKVFKVEPYFSESRTSNSRYSIKDDDDHYKKVTQASNNPVNITGFKDRAIIILDKICARKVIFKVFNDDMSFPDEEVFISDLANANDQLLTKQIDNLMPCTEYEVEMDFFLSSENTVADYYSEPIFFTTKPDKKDLEKYTTYTDSEKTLRWNFIDFVADECTVDEGDTTFTLTIDGIEQEVDEESSKVLSPDSCRVNVHLLVRYSKHSWEEPWKQTAFEKQITGAKRYGEKECDLEPEDRQSQTEVMPESSTTSQKLDQTKDTKDLQNTILIASLCGVASIAIIGFVIVVVVFKLKTRAPAPERGRIELNPIYGDYYQGEPEYSTVTDNNPNYEVTG